MFPSGKNLTTSPVLYALSKGFLVENGLLTNTSFVLSGLFKYPFATCGPVINNSPLAPTGSLWFNSSITYK